MDYNASISMCPKLIRIEDSCYRRLDCDADGIIDDFTNLKPHSLNVMSAPNTHMAYLIEELKSEDCVPLDIDDEDFILKLNDNEELNYDDNMSGFVLNMHLCNSFFGYIIGKRGQTKINIEAETQTLIKLPKMKLSQNENSSFIKILGTNKQNVIKAFKRIRNLEKNFRLKQKLTHFLSIPISSEPKIRERFLEFKSLILSDPKYSTTKGIDESVFQSEDRLHLTLRVLYIGDSYERKLAINELENFNQNFLRPFLNNQEGIILHMKGLDIMNDDPSAVNVLYAKVLEVGNRGLFQQIVNKLYDWFTETGLVCEHDRYEPTSKFKVKIHATLMNTRHRIKQEPDDTNRNDLKINVSSILDKYGDFDFGCFQFNQIHISTRVLYDEQQYYLPLSKIEF